MSQSFVDQVNNNARYLCGNKIMIKYQWDNGDRKSELSYENLYDAIRLGFYWCDLWLETRISMYHMMFGVDYEILESTYGMEQIAWI